MLDVVAQKRGDQRGVPPAIFVDADPQRLLGVAGQLRRSWLAGCRGAVGRGGRRTVLPGNEGMGDRLLWLASADRLVGLRADIPLVVHFADLDAAAATIAAADLGMECLKRGMVEIVDVEMQRHIGALGDLRQRRGQLGNR